MKKFTVTDEENFVFMKFLIVKDASGRNLRTSHSQLLGKRLSG